MDKFREWLTNKANEYERAAIKAERDGLNNLADSFIARRYELLYVMGAYDGVKENE